MRWVGAWPDSRLEADALDAGLVTEFEERRQTAVEAAASEAEVALSEDFLAAVGAKFFALLRKQGDRTPRRPLGVRETLHLTEPRAAARARRARPRARRGVGGRA